MSELLSSGYTCHNLFTYKCILCKSMQSMQLIQYNTPLHSLTEEIRSFAASLPGWLKAALKDLPELLVKTKQKGVCVCVRVCVSVCAGACVVCGRAGACVVCGRVCGCSLSVHPSICLFVRVCVCV